MVRATRLMGGLALAVMLMTVGACGATSAARPGASGTFSRAVSSAPAAPMVTSAFAGLELSHPASWAQFFLSPSDSVDPQAAGYLTNEPIPAACRGTAPATVVCGQPVTTMGSGGVYITVQVLYQQPAPLPQTNTTIGGYPADSVIGPDPGTYGCPAATTRTIAVTLARANVQPSQVWIFACLGGPSTRQTQRQVMSMLESARIAMRPPATEPVPGAPICTSRDLIVNPGPPLSLMTQEQGLVYAVLNIGRGTCRISGYPQVQLSARAARLPFDYQDGGGPYLLPGRPPALYLRPGVYAWFQIDTQACETQAGTAATTAEITLPGQTTGTALPAQTRAGASEFSYCGSRGQTLYISALTGY
jgi:Protein of unknown function (DUF4232)